MAAFIIFPAYVRGAGIIVAAIMQDIDASCSRNTAITGAGIMVITWNGLMPALCCSSVDFAAVACAGISIIAMRLVKTATINTVVIGAQVTIIAA